MSFDVKRVQKELVECEQDRDTSGVQAWCLDGDLSHWNGKIKGPSDTPYEGGVFTIDIKLPNTYPFEPPKMTFVTKVWHPNVSSQTGAICLDILKKEWSPALTIKTALLSIQALLSTPEPGDPQDAVVAQMYLKEQAKFVQTAKNWTDFFAREAAGSSEAVKSLTEMGFPEDQAKAALAAAEGNVERATEILLGGGGS
eukprot:CAMPEP_0114553328 /NCGR_PEP_ID=MMETSP0114-20121206/7596_1 /TAXON_ID=31324 /ORGANISM="Goniomonas sp, Strain m" /LENGTH=197 /DNA_ID=CAMNT_0001738257 /DNA_START=30 /DNA_END=623 /DNA_ORIENTATION=+